MVPLDHDYTFLSREYRSLPVHFIHKLRNFVGFLFGIVPFWMALSL